MVYIQNEMEEKQKRKKETEELFFHRPFLNRRIINIE